ncbi:hypothetical protein DL89DRAFT_145953 [Linderina pennispora]|uniref:Uncharacterized protein n=1 Tax=Linderina pennispora TaxID=61395 RepID=A0A1Y1VUP0_9FUNG|nr:uncharacterized protein DL89DRAFT_145953 [Linderina pennispora]ORX64997.1 hypothetical protein DL89DRAFT_145953 [Linderina pennispora]
MRHVYATPSNVSLPTVASESSIEDAVIVDIESTVEAHACDQRRDGEHQRRDAQECCQRIRMHLHPRLAASTPSHPPLPVDLPPLPRFPQPPQTRPVTLSDSGGVAQPQQPQTATPHRSVREEKSALSRSSSIRALRPQAHNGWKSIKNDFEGARCGGLAQECCQCKAGCKASIAGQEFGHAPSTERFVRKAPVLKRRNRNPGAASVVG